MAIVPRGKGQSLDQFNNQLRADPAYRQFLRSIGVNPDRAVTLSGSQRSQAERWVRSRYQNLPGKFQIDPAGNINTDHGLSTAWSNPYFRYPLLAAGAVGTAGALGAFGGAAGAGGAAGGAGGINAGVGSLGAAGLPGGAFYGAAAPGALGGAIGAGAGAGLGAAATGGGSSLLGKVLTGLKNYGPLALASIPAIKGAFGGGGGNTPAEQQLNDIMGMAKKRIEGAEPLYQQLLAGAGDDANLARSRSAQGAPLLQALTAMANAQVPDAYRKG